MGRVWRHIVKHQSTKSESAAKRQRRGNNIHFTNVDENQRVNNESVDHNVQIVLKCGLSRGVHIG
eukprot:376719-Heterocapsa_arctica.AAC.1